MRCLLPSRRLCALPALAALALLAAAAPAGAATHAPCWKLVLQESYSGNFDTIYPHSCYRQAMERIPTQLLIYSDTREQIQAAANAALTGRKYAVPTPAGSGSGGGATGSSGKRTSASRSASGGSDGVPTAIIVLGVAAVALLLVGGAGEAWRRTRRG